MPAPTLFAEPHKWGLGWGAYCSCLLLLDEFCSSRGPLAILMELLLEWE